MKTITIDRLQVQLNEGEYKINILCVNSNSGVEGHWYINKENLNTLQENCVLTCTQNSSDVIVVTENITIFIIELTQYILHISREDFITNILALALLG